MERINTSTPFSQEVLKNGSMPMVKKTPATVIRNRNSSTPRKSKLHPGKNISEDLFMAAAIGDLDWMKQSLIGNDGVIEFDQNGFAAIHLCAIHGRLDCLKHLVENENYDVNLPSSNGWRPVHLCISSQTGKRSHICLRYLLSMGADPSVVNDDKATPVHQAASEGQVECLNALIEAGAVINAVDRRGHKPIDLAKLWGHRKCARLLASEMWHQDKGNIAAENRLLEKVKMQQVLKEIEMEEMSKLDNQIKADKLHSEWMKKKGLLSDIKQKTSVSPDIKRVNFEAFQNVNSSYKPKGKRAPIQYQNLNRLPPSSATLYELGSREASGEIEQRPSDGSKSGIQRTKQVHHERYWKYSSHPPSPDYITNLGDHFPRDFYTNLPRYPLKRGGVQEDPERAKSAVMMNINRNSLLNTPNMQKDILKRKLKERKPRERDVVFRCKNVIDIPKRKAGDIDIIHKPEAALHMGNDLESILFKLAHHYPKSGKSSVASSAKSRQSSAKKLGKKEQRVNFYLESEQDQSVSQGTLSNLPESTLFPAMMNTSFQQQT